MTYQVVVQFKGDLLADFEALVQIEDAIMAALGSTADVDGHDTGSGESNIFIFTSDPSRTLGLIKPELQSRGLLSQTSVAFREAGTDAYTVIWPEQFSGEFTVQ